MGSQGVVPAAKRWVSFEVEFLHLGVGDFDSSLVFAREQVSADGETCGCFGGADEVEHLVNVGEGLTGPVRADLAEQAMLNGIPFGCAGRVVTDRDCDAERSAKRVSNRLPPSTAA